MRRRPAIPAPHLRADLGHEIPPQGGGWRVRRSAPSTIPGRAWPRRSRPPSPSAPARALGDGASPRRMADFAFLPAGRILAGAGTGRDVTLFNCFVMGRIEDDLGSIFENVKEAALTMQQGGGIGHDFSTLRPKGALVKSIGADASGPVSFMDVWDAMCRTIMSAGARRGAMMATLRCDHPDIEAFIDAKADAARLRNFNLSVLVTDAFMRAVRNDAPWDLVFDGTDLPHACRARALWDRIMRADLRLRRARRDLHRPHQRREQPRLLRGRSAPPIRAASSRCRPTAPACSARSIWRGWSTSRSRRRRGSTRRGLRSSTATAVRFLDNVIDVSELSAARAAPGGQGQAPHRPRRHRPRRRADPVRRALRHARGRGAGRALDGGHRARGLSRQRRARRARRAPSRCYDAERVPGRAQRARACPRTCAARSPGTASATACLTSIAPTGTISLLAGNVSSGIEPVFDFRYERRVLERDGTTRARRRWRTTPTRCSAQRFGADAPLTEAFVTAEELSPARASRDAGGPAAARRQLDLQDHQLSRPTSASRPSRTSIWRPTRWASRAAPPFGPTP